ncbi:MAG: hypothetical protein WCS27_09520 [Victivallaceae bacterium]
MKTKEKSLRIVFCFVLLFASGFAGNIFAQDKMKEAAIVKGEKYEYGKKRQHFVRRLADAVKENGYTPDLVGMDIFFEVNKKECASYKRILVPCTVTALTPEMHEGMTEYVKNGGLLILNRLPAVIDTNNNYKFDKEDRRLGRKGFDLIGVYSNSTVNIAKLKVSSLTPITEGLPLDEWLPLSPSAKGQAAIIRNTETIQLIAAHLTENAKGRYRMDQPFLTYKRTGNGACIYVVPFIYWAKTPSEHLKTVFKNVMSEKTLEWLTTQPEP